MVMLLYANLSYAFKLRLYHRDLYLGLLPDRDAVPTMVNYEICQKFETEFVGLHSKQSYIFVKDTTNYCLSVSKERSNELVYWSHHGNSDQRWKIIHGKLNAVRLKHEDECLEYLPDDDLLRLQSCNESENQLFNMIEDEDEDHGLPTQINVTYTHDLDYNALNEGHSNGFGNGRGSAHGHLGGAKHGSGYGNVGGGYGGPGKGGKGFNGNDGGGIGSSPFGGLGSGGRGPGGNAGNGGKSLGGGGSGHGANNGRVGGHGGNGATSRGTWSGHGTIGCYTRQDASSIPDSLESLVSTTDTDLQSNNEDKTADKDEEKEANEVGTTTDTLTCTLESNVLDDNLYDVRKNSKDVAEDNNEDERKRPVERINTSTNAQENDEKDPKTIASIFDSERIDRQNLTEHESNSSDHSNNHDKHDKKKHKLVKGIAKQKKESNLLGDCSDKENLNASKCGDWDFHDKGHHPEMQAYYDHGHGSAPK